MKVSILLLLAVLPVVGFARNDFWLSRTYSVALNFGGADLGKKNAPTPKKVSLPEFPAEMIRIGVGGEVTLDYTVSSDGRVSEIAIVKSSSEEFSKAVSATAPMWIFDPAIDLSGSKPVSARMRCKVRFSMTEEEPNQALEPTPMSVTPPAAQEPRRP